MVKTWVEGFGLGLALGLEVLGWFGLYVIWVSGGSARLELHLAVLGPCRAE